MYAPYGSTTTYHPDTTYHPKVCPFTLSTLSTQMHALCSVLGPESHLPELRFGCSASGADVGHHRPGSEEEDLFLIRVCNPWLLRYMPWFHLEQQGSYTQTRHICLH